MDLYTSGKEVADESSVDDMKKIIALVLTLMLLLAGLPTLYAQSEQHADLAVSFKPTEGQDGKVVLEINIAVNNGASDQSISLLEFRYENELVASLFNVAAKSSAFARSNPLDMSMASLTSDLEIEVSYIDFNGEPVVQWMTVPYEAAEPKIVFKRTASTTAVAAGESIKLTYIVKNEGGVALSDVEISDDLPGVGTVGKVDLLQPGDLREFNVEVKLDKDEKSQPRVSYRTSAYEQSTVLVLDEMSLVIYNPKLSVTLKSDVSVVQAGDSVTLVCSVVNEGNVAFTNVSITDETLGSIIDNAQIEVGKAYSWNKLIKPVSSQNYMLTVRAIDKSGKSYTAISNIVAIEVAAPEQGEDADTLEVSVTPNVKELEQPGEINFNMLLRNIGKQDVTGLTISDRGGNVLESIDTLPPGDRVIPIAVSVTESGDYFFTVDATMASGTKVQRVTAPIHITVGVEPTADETPAPDETETPESDAVDEEDVRGIAPWVLALLIVIALLIVACVVVLVLLQVRANRSREEEEEYIPPQSYERPRAPQNPYDYREEISRVATEYSRPIPQAEQLRDERPAPRPAPYPDEDDETPTVYQSPHGKPSEPRTRRNN